jgi:hypothetical protein
MATKKQMNNESHNEAPSPQDRVWFQTPVWINEDQTTNDRFIDEHTTPILLNRLRELLIVQVAKEERMVFFFPVHNPRPLCMYDAHGNGHPSFEWVQPNHVYETVNFLMWKRALKPELALSFMGLFNSKTESDGCWTFHIGSLGEVAEKHVLKWLSE